MRVIGLSGRARAGKDTVARILLEELQDVHVVKQSFADALKVSAARALGFDGPPEACVEFCDALKVGAGSVTTYLPTDALELPSLVVSGREFLQRYGTEAHRDVFGSDFWVDAVLPPGRADCEVLVIPDVRFENEACRIHEHGGELWRVVRPGGERVLGHVSEAGLPDHMIDFDVANTGTLDDLRAAVRLALR